MIYEYSQVSGTHESFLDFTHLIAVTFRCAVVQGVDTKWDEALLSISIMPQDSVLESQYKVWIRDSEQFNKVLVLYGQDIEQKDVHQSYQRLKKMLKRFLDQKERNRNFVCQRRSNRDRDTAESKKQGGLEEW